MKSIENLYWKAAWRRKAKAQLKKEPLCRWCLEGIGQGNGRTLTKAEVCDHIQPAVDEKTFWNNEVQSLCKACNRQKGRTDDRDFHKRRRRLTPVLWG